MLDTHIAVWLTANPDQLTQRERAALRQPNRELLLSTIAIWEVRMKWEAAERKGEAHRIPSPHEVIALARAYSIEVIALTIEDHLALLKTSLNHNDPFDQMLLVHAQQLGARLMTRDRHLAAHPLSLPL